MAPKTKFAMLIALLAAGCGGSKGKPDGGDGGPYADPWTVRASSEVDPVRGYRVLHGIVHNHSPYSHDACDNEPFIDGERNEQCFEDVRAGMCETMQDFVFLTDHDTLFAEYEYPEVLLWAEGDTLIERGGAPVANRVACPGGHEVIVAAGTESEMMPIGLEHHVGDTIAERKDWYGRADEEAVRAFQDAGALVFLQHTEGWPVETVLGLPIDGIECYNLHQNMMENLGAALELALLLEDDPEGLPQVEVAIVALLQENQADMYRWALALQQRHLPAVLATDAHRNVFPNPSPDGERIDSFRRMMHWFSNYVLVPAGSDTDDAVLKEAIGHGRMYGAFDVMGYPVGFDFRAEAGGDTFEMGDSAPAGDGPELVLQIPTVYRLDPALDPPEVFGRILRAEADGSWSEVTRGTQDLRVPVGAGAYRAEIRVVPHHLLPWLGDKPDYDIPDKYMKEFPWIYSNPIYVE